jgi:Holliday junction resolvase RusA-like endonuclease
MTEPLALDLDLDLPQAPLPVAHSPLGLVFTVWGEPIPKGSTKAFVVKGRARVTNDNPRTRNWQALITDAAIQIVADEPPLAGAVHIALHFTLPRPKSVKRRFPTVKPDIDKLARAALDSLTGSVFVDDAQVLKLDASKDYLGMPGALPRAGVCIEVTPVLA